MSLLNFSELGPKDSRRKKPLKLVLGIGALLGAIALGSTLAASINLNTGAPVEFGQGVAQTTACSGDSSILITPFSTFKNAESAGAYYFTSVRLSNIPSNCEGVNFRFSAYDRSGNILRLTSDCSDIGTTPVIRFTGDGGTDHTSNSWGDMFTTVTNKSSSAFSVSWDDSEEGCSSSALAENVYRITLQSDGLATVPVNWNEITWTGSTSNGPAIYANGLTNGKPSWLDDANVSASDFTYGFSSSGMGIAGDANEYGFPYVTNFDIPSASKVTIQFHFYYGNSCADQGVIIFPTGTTPEFTWGTNSTGLIGEWNCGHSQLGGPSGGTGGGGGGILSVGSAYIGVIIYDPNLGSDNFTLITKELDGTIIDTSTISQTLPTGLDYRIGLSADCDAMEGGDTSYYKNLIITLG